MFPISSWFSSSLAWRSARICFCQVSLCFSMALSSLAASAISERFSTQIRGLDVTITTSAQTDEEAYALLEAFGMPFSKDGNPYVKNEES